MREANKYSNTHSVIDRENNKRLRHCGRGKFSINKERPFTGYTFHLIGKISPDGDPAKELQFVHRLQLVKH